MDATTVGVDLAKNVFQIALADGRGHIVERHRLTRARFDRFFVNRAACRIVMEACGSAHHHARRLSSQGHDVVLRHRLNRPRDARQRGAEGTIDADDLRQRGAVLQRLTNLRLLARLARYDPLGG